MNCETIDVFCHFLPPRYVAALERRVVPPFMFQRACAIPDMTDIDARRRVLDQLGDYRQILSLTSPPIESIATGDDAIDLSRIANDALAELSREHADRFPTFVATLPFADADAAIDELHRAMRELGAAGVQAFSNVNGAPLDQPATLTILEEAARIGAAVWLHPIRPRDRADYPTESASRYDMWWALGWPHETSVAMGRLVFSGFFDRHPDAVVIAHHCGGTAPMLAGRLDRGLAMRGSRTPPGAEADDAGDLQEEPIAAFQRFHADTASFGASASIAAAIEFFGMERMVFASDMPFDPGAALKALDEVDIDDDARRRIRAGNAARLLGLDAGENGANQRVNVGEGA